MENIKLDKKIDIVIELLRHNTAILLFRGGATQDNICKSLHIRKTKVVEMLKGIKKDK